MQETGRRRTFQLATLLIVCIVLASTGLQYFIAQALGSQKTVSGYGVIHNPGIQASILNVRTYVGGSERSGVTCFVTYPNGTQKQVVSPYIDSDAPVGSYGAEASYQGDTDQDSGYLSADSVLTLRLDFDVAPPPPPPPGGMIVGVDIYWGTTESQFLNNNLAKMEECGITMVRIFMSDINNLRSLIPAIVDNDIAVIGVLMRTDYAPDNVNAWGDYVFSVVSEFKNYVHVWEMWNEPNLNQFFSGKDPAKYTNFLKEGYTRAKQADPTCFVLGGSIAWTHSSARDFLRAMYQNGAKDYMDALAHHPYCYPYAPDAHPTNPYTDLPKIKAIMEEYGDPNNIWITEIGWASNDDAHIGETLQAQYLVECLNLAKDWGWVEAFIIYNWKDSSSSGKFTKGLLTSSYERKEAFYAVKAWIAENFLASEIFSNINRDGNTNTLDVLEIAAAFGMEEGDPDWNPNADLNQDAIIDILDILLAMVNSKEDL